MPMGGLNLNQIQSKPQRASDPKASKAGNGSFSSFLKKDIQIGSGQLSDKKKEAFYHELGILAEAGVDIKSSLEIIEKEQKKQKDKSLFTGIKEKVIYGSTLSEAIGNSKKFSKYEYYSLQIGEESGKLADVLKELAAFYQGKIKQRRQIISALSYPIIVFISSLGAIFFMMHFIVPMFADVFKRFGGKLPAITQAIISISDAFSAYFLWFIIAMAGIVILFYSQRKKHWFRKMYTAVILRTPLVGPLTKKIYLARFCQSLTLLIASKIPLLRAINLVKQMVSFYPLEVALNQIETDILHGKPLHESLAAFKIFPSRLISLVKVGEDVNRLDVFFDKVGNQYSEEIEHQTAILSSLIEPFMIIFLGLVVGLILIAMYLPLFQLSSQFG